MLRKLDRESRKYTTSSTKHSRRCARERSCQSSRRSLVCLFVNQLTWSSSRLTAAGTLYFNCGEGVRGCKTRPFGGTRSARAACLRLEGYCKGDTTIRPAASSWRIFTGNQIRVVKVPPLAIRRTERSGLVNVRCGNQRFCKELN